MSEWISTKEKLPAIVREYGGQDSKMYGESVPVLTFNGSEINVAYFYKSGTWDSMDGEAIRKVSHWMPLPEPPK